MEKTSCIAQSVSLKASRMDDIADYIAQDNPGRAVTFIQDIRMKFRDIQRDPLIYQQAGADDPGGGLRSTQRMGFALD